MAVTIGELQIDVKSGAGASAAETPAAAPSKKPGEQRQHNIMLAERRARLNTE
jgi:hypothetical protein